MVVMIFSSIISSTFGLLAFEKEAKATPPEVRFPVEFFSLYREVDEIYKLPWALAAGIHLVQTEFADSSGWFKYRDALHLPDEIWNGWKTSKREYWQYKSYAESEEGFPEDYTPYQPDRSQLEDVAYTLGAYFEGVNYTDDMLLNKKLDDLTGERKKTDQAKFYYWLFSLMYGRAHWPVPEQFGIAYITSPFGERFDPFTGERKYHAGIDIAPPEGEPVFAFADGKIVYSGSAGGYGTLIIIEHEDFIRKDGEKETIRTYYGHSRNLIVTEGMEVVGGQKIAEIGNEGRSTGPHLHFEVRIKPSLFTDWEPVDPMDYLITPDELQKN